MDAALREPGVALESLLRRYAEVGLSTKPSKVHDYAREQDLLGYRLDHNRLRISASRYANLRDAVGALRRRSWARPREVEALLGAVGLAGARGPPRELPCAAAPELRERDVAAALDDLVARA